MQIRVKPLYDHSYSSWSTPQRLVCDPRDGDNHVLKTALLVGLGTVVSVLGTLVLCRRFSLLRKIFPRIPGVKDPIGEKMHSGELVAWDPVAMEECTVSQVQVLKET